MSEAEDRRQFKTMPSAAAAVDDRDMRDTALALWMMQKSWDSRQLSEG